MKNNILNIKSTGQKITQIVIITAVAAILFNMDTAFAQEVSNWGDAAKANTTPIGKFVKSVTSVIMVVFALISVIIAGLAFKGLSGSGDWRTFWNKIAGSIGLFTVPFIINSLLDAGKNPS